MGGPIIPPIAGAGSIAFSGLQGVDISGATDGAPLVYDDGAGVWTYGTKFDHEETGIGGSAQLYANIEAAGGGIIITGVVIDTFPPVTTVFLENQDAGGGDVYAFGELRAESGGTETTTASVSVGAGSADQATTVTLTAGGTDGKIVLAEGVIVLNAGAVPTATGDAGDDYQIAIDDDFLYVKTSGAGWKRIALSVIP